MGTQDSESSGSPPPLTPKTTPTHPVVGDPVDPTTSLRAGCGDGRTQDGPHPPRRPRSGSSCPPGPSPRPGPAEGRRRRSRGEQPPVVARVGSRAGCRGGRGWERHPGVRTLLPRREGSRRTDDTGAWGLTRRTSFSYRGYTVESSPRRRSVGGNPCAPDVGGGG